MKNALKFACLTSGALMISDCYCAPDIKDQTDHPNIVIIMVDDMGYSDIGCYGAEVIETPRIDQLAEKGLKMRNFYNTGKCHSSRVSLLSGLWCDQAGSISLRYAVTFPQLLKNAGYNTGMIGKWHLNNHPMDYGFDKYFGHLSGASDYIGGNTTWQYGRDVYSDFGATAKEFYATDAMTDYAIQFINEFEKDEEKPFILYIAYNAPHSPLQAPEALVRKYRGRFMDGWETIQQKIFENQLSLGVIKEGTQIPPWPAHHRNWEGTTDLEKSWEDYRRAIFAAMVESLDYNIGRLVDEMIRLGKWENTIFMFLSDNGADSREISRTTNLLPWEANFDLHIGTEWAGVANTPFRWYKQNQHAGGIATPMIISWPNGLKVNGWSDFRGHIVDIYPTLLELSGVNYPERYNGEMTLPLEGVSMYPFIKGEKQQREKYIYLKYASNKGIIVGNMKLVSARKGPWELYDLDVDPNELNDLSSVLPWKVMELEEKWIEIAKKDGNSLKDAGVNKKMIPWGFRSFSNNRDARAGDPLNSEMPPAWKTKPLLE